jgi:hypothetical protein
LKPEWWSSPLAQEEKSREERKPVTRNDNNNNNNNNYHPPLHLNLKLTVDCQPAIMTPQRTYKHGDYLLLYTTLSNCDWSCVLNENSIDSAVHSLTARMSEAMNEAIPSLIPNSSTFPHWFSTSLKYYIKKKNHFFLNIKNRFPITIIVLLHV